MPSRRLTLLILIAILALAAALRFYRIGAQSFWNDEGNSARLAERSVDLILAGAAADIHPPLYYLTLHVWRDVFGQSEAALRGLSAVFGLITVVFVFLLGRRLFDARVGLLAAFLAAVNPFQIYYSQEARMYMMLTAIGVVSTYLLVRLIDFWGLRPRIHIPHRRYYVLYVASLAAGLYTHYAFPFIIGVHFFIVLAWALYRPEQLTSRVFPWLAMALAAGAIFAPWLSIAVRQVSTWPSLAQTLDAGAQLLDTFGYYLLGSTAQPGTTAVALIIAAFFLAMSFWTPDAFDEPEPEWETTLPRALRFGSIALYWLLPIALIFAFGLFKEAYLKFLLAGSPAFCLLLARGVDNGWRIARGALAMPRELTGPRELAFGWVAIVLFLAGLMLAPTAASLQRLYFDPAVARADYRAIAQAIKSVWRDGDAVILHAANQWEVFTYYFPDGPDVYPIVKQRPLDPAATDRELRDIVATHRRLFVLYWAAEESDPTRFVETWLETNTYKASDTWYGDVRLATHAVPLETADSPSTRLDVQLGDRIRLEGYSLLTPSVQPGDILQLALFWRCDTPVAERYKVFVHVLDANGAIVSQTDREPGNDLAPTTIWKPGQSIVDRYGVSIPATTAPGAYRISIGMYSLSDNRLRIFERGADIGDALPLAEVSVR